MMLHTAINKDSNFLDILTEGPVRIMASKLSLRDKIMMSLLAPVLIGIGYGILKEQPPQNYADYLFLALFAALFISVYILLIRTLFFPAPDLTIDTQGLQFDNSSEKIPWASVDNIYSESFFNTVKIKLRNGISYRIYTDTENTPFFVFLNNLGWLHGKHSFASPDLLTSLLTTIERYGMHFGNETVGQYRRNLVKPFKITLIAIIFFSLIGAAFILLPMRMTYLGEISEQQVIRFALTVAATFCIVFAIFLKIYFDPAHRKTQDVYLNAQGIKIDYSDESKQDLAWKTVLEEWNHENYGQDGSYLFEIYPHTDGGFLLMDLLPYAATYFTAENNEAKNGTDIS